MNANELRNLDTWFSTPKLVKLETGSKPEEQGSPLGPRARRYPLWMSRVQIRKQQFSSRIGRGRLGGGRSPATEAARTADRAAKGIQEEPPHTGRTVRVRELATEACGIATRSVGQWRQVSEPQGPSGRARRVPPARSWEQCPCSGAFGAPPALSLVEPIIAQGQRLMAGISSRARMARVRFKVRCIGPRRAGLDRMANRA